MTLNFPNKIDNPTKSDLKILNFLEKNKESFLMMTIGDVSEALDMSDATISRFSKKVGCQDFKDLKNQVFNQVSYIGAAGKMKATLSQKSDISVDNYLVKQKSNIDKTLDYLDLDQFDQAVDQIVSSGTVWVFGKLSNKYLSDLLFFRLNRLGISIKKLESSGTELIESMASIKSKDTVVIFSFSKSSWETNTLIDYCRKVGTPTIAFTSRLHIPPEENADINLYVYRGTDNEYHSHAPAVAVIDALVVNVTDKIGDLALDNLEKIKKLKSQYKY